MVNMPPFYDFLHLVPLLIAIAKWRIHPVRLATYSTMASACLCLAEVTYSTIVGGVEPLLLVIVGVQAIKMLFVATLLTFLIWSLFPSIRRARYKSSRHEPQGDKKVP